MFKFEIQNEARWTSQSAKHKLHAVCVSFIHEARAIKNIPNMDKSSSYHWMKTVVFTEKRYIWKHEDIEHAIATIYGCVFHVSR